MLSHHREYLRIIFMAKDCLGSQHVCVCLPPRVLITNSVMWSDVDPIWLDKQVLQLL